MELSYLADLSASDNLTILECKEVNNLDKTRHQQTDNLTILECKDANLCDFIRHNSADNLTILECKVSFIRAFLVRASLII